MFKKLTKKFKKDNKGFTLVELLVVIAIIGVLSAVAVPKVFSSIDKSKVSAVEADYKAIKVATLSYYNDKGKFKKNTTDYIEMTDLEEYLDKTPVKTPFAAGSYALDVLDIDNDSVNEVVLKLDGVSVKKGNFNKLVDDLGEGVVYRDSATGDTYTSDDATTDVTDVYLVISDAE